MLLFKSLIIFVDTNEMIMETNIHQKINLKSKVLRKMKGYTFFTKTYTVDRYKKINFNVDILQSPFYDFDGQGRTNLNKARNF